MGNAVNLAARLCSLPREHPIILSRTTYELLSAKSQIEALGVLPVQDGGTLEIYGLGKAVEHAV
jgi:class 3 adenylate cyclase